MITISPSPKARATLNKATTAPEPSSSSSSSSSGGFGFWSLNSTSLSSPSFLYGSRKKAPLATKKSLPAAPIIIMEAKKKKVTFVAQCQVRTFEVVAMDEEFENTCQDDEDYWEQMGEDYWYQAYDFAAFKKERRIIVDRIRTIGLSRAKGNFSMEGLEYFLTLKAREVHKERVLDGWVSVLEIQADFEKEQDDECYSQEAKVELIASKYAHVSKDCMKDANQRAIETAEEIKAEDDKIVASIPKSPSPPKKGSVSQKDSGTTTTKVKALVWGNTWSSGSSSSSSNNNNTNNSFSTFQKIRPFPRQ